MKFFDIPLSVTTSGKGDFDAYMTAYVPTNGMKLDFNQNRPALIIFPGGGYANTVQHEGEVIALEFAAKGIAAFVVWYSTVNKCLENPPRFPQALAEGLLAIKYVRDHAEEFGVNPHNIAAIGFSAGGHLCACTGTLWKHPLLDPYLPGDRDAYRPDKLLLGYPVITAFGKHRGSFDNLLGTPEEGLRTPEMLELVSLERQVSDETPPCFLFHNFSDSGVPVDNSLKFALALSEHQVPCEMHLYPQGGHGMSLANHVTSSTYVQHPHYSAEWTRHACAFILNEGIQNSK